MIVDYFPKVKVKNVYFESDLRPKVDEILLMANKETFLLRDYTLLLVFEDNSTYEMICKKGYPFDGFSIPWIFRWYIKKGDLGLACALPHDMGFDTNCFRQQYYCDYFFLIALKSMHERLEEKDIDRYGYFKRNAMYISVRCAGQFIYNKPEEHKIEKRQFLEIRKI